MKTTTLLLLLACVTGSAFSQTATVRSVTPAAPQTATVRIYRYMGNYGCWRAEKVFADGAEVAALHRGRYLDVALPPGKHDFHAHVKQQHLVIDMKAGETYFLRAEWCGPKHYDISPQIVNLVPPEQGEAETAELKPEGR